MGRLIDAITAKYFDVRGIRMDRSVVGVVSGMAVLALRALAARFRLAGLSERLTAATARLQGQCLRSAPAGATWTPHTAASGNCHVGRDWRSGRPRSASPRGRF
jgi:hypothetical protein